MRSTSADSVAVDCMCPIGRDVHPPFWSAGSGRSAGARLGPTPPTLHARHTSRLAGATPVADETVSPGIHRVSIDVRRHAERASGPDAVGAISASGLAMARRLRAEGLKFALVVSSPRDRARETAVAIAGRVDESDAIIGGSPDEALTQDQYDALTSQRAVTELLRTSAPSRPVRGGASGLLENGRPASAESRARALRHSRRQHRTTGSVAGRASRSGRRSATGLLLRRHPRSLRRRATNRA